MSKRILRVAFFPDSYLEVNGVAMTSLKLTDYVRRRGLPFLCVHAAEKTEITTAGNFVDLSLKRAAFSFKLDESLKYDPFFNRHIKRVTRALREFAPDVIHITGINDVSIIGAWLAYKLEIPLVGAWHTNVHEFAASRLEKMFRFLPGKFRRAIAGLAKRKILGGAILYYKMPEVVLAPNTELIKILRDGTGKPVNLMTRGVDTEFFAPSKKKVNDGTLRIGFVGRLQAEKNVRVLAGLEKKLLEAGKTDFKFLIVGEGGERRWLEKNMRKAEFTGFLDGENLAEAYAAMDVFAFPSETETFGNVIQEANASGVPAIVTNQGGPKFIVRHGETGFIAGDFEDFAARLLELMNDPEKLAKMKAQARAFALSRSWKSVFETVYESYADAIRHRAARRESTPN